MFLLFSHMLGYMFSLFKQNTLQCRQSHLTIINITLYVECGFYNTRWWFLMCTKTQTKIIHTSYVMMMFIAGWLHTNHIWWDDVEVDDSFNGHPSSSSSVLVGRAKEKVKEFHWMLWAIWEGQQKHRVNRFTGYNKIALLKCLLASISYWMGWFLRKYMGYLLVGLIEFGLRNMFEINQPPGGIENKLTIESITDLLQNILCGVQFR